MIITKKQRTAEIINKNWYHSEEGIAETKEYYDLSKVRLQKRYEVVTEISQTKANGKIKNMEEIIKYCDWCS